VNPIDTAIPAGASEEWAKKLDDKERLFVEGYLQTLNKRQAAEYAGWSTESAKRHAYRLFNRPHVREAIEHLLRTRAGITKRGSSTNSWPSSIPTLPTFLIGTKAASCSSRRLPS
jgi:Terminase small subunit